MAHLIATEQRRDGTSPDASDTRQPGGAWTRPYDDSSLK